MRTGSINRKTAETDITMKLKLVEHIAENLRRMGKEVTVNYD